MHCAHCERRRTFVWRCTSPRMWRRRSLTHPKGTFDMRTCGRASTACVVPGPGACSASHELPSRCDAPNTCTGHMVMHSQLRWRARAHGADGRTSGCDVWEACATFGGSVFFSAVCVGARRRSGARPCERCLRVGATDAFGNARDALVAPRMHRSDAGAAHTIDGSRILADFGRRLLPPFGRFGKALYM